MDIMETEHDLITKRSREVTLRTVLLFFYHPGLDLKMKSAAGEILDSPNAVCM